MIELLSLSEREYLLRLARRSIEAAVRRQPMPEIVWADLSQPLRTLGASFVTLTEREELRGCIGALEAYQPLAQDVQEHAVSAALEDYRFQPVAIHELASLQIEISRLTEPQPLAYEQPEELLGMLRPGLDGVILRDGARRATFLPQVWEKIPDAGSFLDQLCLKMGVWRDQWRNKPLQVFVYQVEEFREETEQP